MPGPEILSGLRIVASPTALKAVDWPHGARILPVADDEVLVFGAGTIEIDDPHALILPEEGFCGIDLERDQLEKWMRREAEWPLPTSSSFFSQGMAAGLPVKVWVDGDRAMIVTRASLRKDLEERL